MGKMQMKPFIGLLIPFGLILLLVTGCSVLQSIAPPPEATPIPTDRTEFTPTPIEPTLGPKEFIDAVYCWESHVDDGEFNLIRFFMDGTVIDLFVQPYNNCQDAWAATEAYITVDKKNNFNHGEYHLSGDRIVFSLAGANSNVTAGEIKGSYLGEKMVLNRQGAEEWEYIQIVGGE
jgi:hypothetical protein